MRRKTISLRTPGVANLGPGGLGAEEFHAIAFVPTTFGGIIFVGASDGLYARSTTPSACWFKLHGAPERTHCDRL